MWESSPGGAPRPQGAARALSLSAPGRRHIIVIVAVIVMVVVVVVIAMVVTIIA